MSGCVLRVSGKAFSPGRFLEKHSLPGAEDRGSFLAVLVSARPGNDFSGQIQEAAAFLASHSSELRELVPSFNAELVSLDFGVWLKDTASQSYCFPLSLVSLAGSLGLSLEVSLYAAADS